MKYKALWKDFLMELRNTWSRFLSILLIVALGVASNDRVLLWIGIRKYCSGDGHNRYGSRRRAWFRFVIGKTDQSLPFWIAKIALVAIKALSLRQAQLKAQRFLIVDYPSQAASFLSPNPHANLLKIVQ